MQEEGKKEEKKIVEDNPEDQIATSMMLVNVKGKDERKEEEKEENKDLDTKPIEGKGK